MARISRMFMLLALMWGSLLIDSDEIESTEWKILQEVLAELRGMKRNIDGLKDAVEELKKYNNIEQQHSDLVDVHLEQRVSDLVYIHLEQRVSDLVDVHLKQPVSDLVDIHLEQRVSDLVDVHLEERVSDLEDVHLEQRVSDLEDIHLEQRVSDLEEFHMERVAPSNGSENAFIKLKVPSTSLLPKHSRNSLSENCTLGKDYVYEEHLETQCQGIELMDWVYADTSPYQCLYQCLKDLRCVAVAVQMEPQIICKGYEEVVYTLPSAGWNLYNITRTSSCIVDGYPYIAFQATISAEQCVLVGQKVVWDVVRASTTTGLGADGVFTCPITGIYEITLHAQPFTCLNTIEYRKIILSIMQNGDIIGSPYSYHESGCDLVPASSTALIHCEGGDTVWVEGASVTDTTCLRPDYWRTSFAIQLQTVKI